MEKQEIYEKVKTCIVGAGTMGAEAVAPEKRLIKDLAFDSIDLLDLLFSIETTFDISIETGEIEELAQSQLGDTPLAVDSIVTPEGLAVIKSLMPEVPDDYYPEEMRVYQIPFLFTVQTLCNLVEHKLDEK